MSDKILIDETFSGLLKILQGKQTLPRLLQSQIQYLHVSTSSLHGQVHLFPHMQSPTHSQVTFTGGTFVG